MNFFKIFLLSIVCIQIAKVSAADKSTLSNEINRIGDSLFFGRSFEREEDVVKALRSNGLQGYEEKGEGLVSYAYVFGLHKVPYAYKTRNDLVKAAKAYKKPGEKSIEQKIIDAQKIIKAEARNRSCCVVS